jgi:hypothetical protein
MKTEPQTLEARLPTIWPSRRSPLSVLEDEREPRRPQFSARHSAAERIEHGALLGGE